MSSNLSFRVPPTEQPRLAAQHRVAIVTGSYDQSIDGVALTLNRLAARLLQLGHSVLVLCPGDVARPPVLEHAGLLVRVPSTPLPVWSEYRLTWGLGGTARAALEQFRPTVLHVAARGIPRLVVWPRGVDVALFSPSKRRAAAGSVPTVLLVARLRWEKGLADFAAVVRRLEARAGRGAAFRTEVVGDGPARRRLEQLLPRASFRGLLTGEALAAAYAGADVFLYPSTTEGWGGTCLEAQASGLPVVATDSPGVADVISAGASGLLAPPGDVGAMAAHVAALLANRSLRVAMGRAAAAHASTFSWEASGDLVLAQYDGMASRVGRGV
ncbi:hypothetical protein EMIHUDRAFT_97678 [Emiliania huxleyi CCMP1516]|uniref:Glycosyltransferase subfamily 4-like N-terminal domain-containing protein n=2 Tax=Emiliania huxleyi TaxID=2903 RepID=A0A0D3KUM3_EMIH1|nr:hypothetical protein EMIHUDRAFT_97678 [Emiliania huxleyi CCMP1516]EOD39458.1 hypothetical protein EMIHUDRAFT_97678 [Emiliania huxleyi CCMP1516]|eukprot:XP_005791887.1 hypothetical protein EMIHUDRAFT_97678 [Emiliania huxleyi CCMP1516]